MREEVSSLSYGTNDNARRVVPILSRDTKNAAQKRKRLSNKSGQSLFYIVRLCEWDSSRHISLRIVSRVFVGVSVCD